MQEMHANDADRGQIVDCPHCQTENRVPMPGDMDHALLLLCKVPRFLTYLILLQMLTAALLGVLILILIRL
jgi:hypothetical protein